MWHCASAATRSCSGFHRAGSPRNAGSAESASEFSSSVGMGPQQHFAQLSVESDARTSGSIRRLLLRLLRDVVPTKALLREGDFLDNLSYRQSTGGDSRSPTTELSDTPERSEGMETRGPSFPGRAGHGGPAVVVMGV